jgi:sigma54-dependent transcription regulator
LTAIRDIATKRLHEFVDAPTGPTASEFEDAFIGFCRRSGLPQPLCNTRVGRFEVDAYFPVQRVIVELDGWRFHSSRASFESDRERDAALLALGIVTVRITWNRLIKTPEREAARLRKILEARSRQAG